MRMLHDSAFKELEVFETINLYCRGKQSRLVMAQSEIYDRNFGMPQ